MNTANAAKMPEEWWPAQPVMDAHLSPRERYMKMRTALYALRNKEPKSLGYDEWHRMLCGMAHYLGKNETSRELAHEFSATSEKYDAKFLDEKVWKYIKNQRGGGRVTTGASVFAEAKRRGWSGMAYDALSLDAPVVNIGQWEGTLKQAVRKLKMDIPKAQRQQGKGLDCTVHAHRDQREIVGVLRLGADGRPEIFNRGNETLYLIGEDGEPI